MSSDRDLAAHQAKVLMRPPRPAIVRSLLEGATTVAEIQRLLPGIEFNDLYYHLVVLAETELVKRDRNGRWTVP